MTTKDLILATGMVVCLACLIGLYTMGRTAREQLAKINTDCYVTIKGSEANISAMTPQCLGALTDWFCTGGMNHPALTISCEWDVPVDGPEPVGAGPSPGVDPPTEDSFPAVD